VTLPIASATHPDASQASTQHCDQKMVAKDGCKRNLRNEGKKEVRSRKKKRRVVLLQANEEEAEQENRQGWC